MRVEGYGEIDLSRTQCIEIVNKFKSGNFDVRKKKRDGKPETFGDNVWQALIIEDDGQTQEQLAKSLAIDTAKRLTLENVFKR